METVFSLTDPLLTFQQEPHLTAEEFIGILRGSTLAERRPVENMPMMEAMLRNADIVLTARFAQRLIGISRSITDFAYATYLSDLAVDRDFQGRGLGKELIRRTHEIAGLSTMLILLAAPQAATYYPHIGMTSHTSCWTFPRQRTELLDRDANSRQALDPSTTIDRC
jgi:GNAT superfamily N-acetyltransferase